MLPRGDIIEKFASQQHGLGTQNFVAYVVLGCGLLGFQEVQTSMCGLGRVSALIPTKSLRPQLKYPLT